MKKAIFTFGLFSLMMVLTSFTTIEIGGQSAPRNPSEIGGQSVPRNSGYTAEIGGQSAPRNFSEIGGQSAPRN